jgi:hypothetical protein
VTQIDPAMREPKGDHNRRLSLGVDPDRFAALAGISTEDLRKYELTSPDEDFDLEIARLVGEALERLEANPPPTEAVRN